MRKGPELADRPWLASRRWRDGWVRDQSGKFIVFSSLLTVIWNAIAVLAMRAALIDQPREIGLIVVATALLAIGLAIAAWAARQIMVRVKYGRPVLELETLPGAIGGWLAGTIHVPVALAAAGGVGLELECVMRVRRGTSSGKSAPSEEIIWQSEQKLTGRLPRDAIGGTTIPVAFEIPSKARPTGRVGRDVVFWRLRARAGSTGADFDATFIVPVFAVPGAGSAAPKAEVVSRGLR